jgi:hypothetical protein
MKKLYVLVSDGGDGSYSTHYTFDEQWINKQEQRDADGDFGYDGYDLGVDGDGFHYKVLTVPDECTLESLGIHKDCAKDK